MNAHYKHILIATDLLPNSIKMIKKAQRLSETLGDKISLLYVIERDLASEHIYVDQDEYESDVVNEAKHKFSELGNAIQIPETDQLVIIDSPKSAIVKTAENLHCDLIIVGSHDRHGLQKLIGSTANAVLHHARCDVFVVRYID